MQIQRRGTRSVAIGNSAIGGNAPILIQSMTNTDTADFARTKAQIISLRHAGCDLIRLAVPDQAAVESFEHLVRDLKLPLIADIHFDYRLALAALRAGAAKVRINPGNIGGLEKMMAVVGAARERGAALRLGVNSGSVPRESLAKFGGPTAEALVASAMMYTDVILQSGFENLVVSLKSSNVARTIDAYRKFSSVSDLPLHVGVTEAGTMELGVVRSAVGIGTLLAEGIGDTIRVSLTADPVQEIPVAKEILSCLGLSPGRLRVISCPTCARTSVDIISASLRVESALADVADFPLTVAVMGCSVNGPGEAREADLGIALAGGKAMLFRHGMPQELMELDDAIDSLVLAARQIIAESELATR